MTANCGEAGGVECRDLDIGAALLDPRSGPLPAQSGDQLIKRVAVEQQRRIVAAKIGRLFENVAARPREMQCAATPQ